MIVAIAETEVERLGRCAADCELWAAELDCPPWERALLLERAENYRRQQVLFLSGLHKCAGLGCLAMVAGLEYCQKCTNQRETAAPYPFANILSEWPSWAKWAVRAFVIVIVIAVAVVVALAVIL